MHLKSTFTPSISLLLLTLTAFATEAQSASRGNQSSCILEQVKTATSPSLPRRLKDVLHLVDGHSSLNLAAWAKDIVHVRTEIEALKPAQHAELRREIARLYPSATSSTRQGVGTKRVLDILISYEFPLQTRVRIAAENAKKQGQSTSKAVRETYEAHLNDVQSMMGNRQASLQIASALQEILRDPRNHDLLPKNTRLRIFGSQTNGTARSHSDLDILISDDVLEHGGLQRLKERLSQQLKIRLGDGVPPIEDLFPIERDEGVRLMGLKPPIQIEISENKAQLLLQSSALHLHMSRSHHSTSSYPLENVGPTVSYDIELSPAALPR